MQFIEMFASDLYKTLTNATPRKTKTTQKKIIVEPVTKGEKIFAVEEPRVQSSHQMSPISQNETKIEHTTNSTTPVQEMEEAKVNVPIEMIYIILVGKWRCHQDI